MSKDPFFSEPRRSGTVSLGCGTLILIAIIVAIFGRSGDANRVERVLLTVQYDLQDQRREIKAQTEELRALREAVESLRQEIERRPLPAERPGAF